MSNINKYFDWKAFARYIQDEFRCVVVPIDRDGYPWKDWKKLKDKKITAKDFERWISNENFGGFGAWIGDSELPIVLHPTVNDLYKIDPLVFAFSKLPVKDLSKLTDWRSLVKGIDDLREKYGV